MELSARHGNRLLRRLQLYRARLARLRPSQPRRRLAFVYSGAPARTGPQPRRGGGGRDSCRDGWVNATAYGAVCLTRTLFLWETVRSDCNALLGVCVLFFRVCMVTEERVVWN